MSQTQQFILQLMQEGREWAKLILPALLALHIPAPKYARNSDNGDNAKHD